MLRITGLDVPAKGERRRLWVGPDMETSEPVEGGKELEDIFHSYHTLDCSMIDFRVAVELIKQGTPAKEAFALLKPR